MIETMKLNCLEIEPAGSADAAVIWLHGLGADARDFEGVVPALKLPSDINIRFIFPNAPSIPVTINSGFVMPAWYDILALSEKREINETQFYASVDATRELIDREITRGIKSERIILAGFSQGGAIVYQTALSEGRKLGGLLALSTYIANPRDIQLNPANANIPIQVCHGSYDPMVTTPMAEQALAVLKELGLNPQFNTYPMEHEVCLAEIKDISNWLQQCLLAA